MDYYNEIKNKLMDNELYSRVKDYSKERYRMITYYEIGKLLNEAGRVYGENIIGEYSKKLIIDVGKKYNKRTLFRMRQFYKLFSNEKVSPVVSQFNQHMTNKVAPLVTQLTWSHALILLPIKDIDKINYYINQISERNLSKRQLETIIKNKEYERLDNDTKRKLIVNNKTNVKDLVKNPIIMKIYPKKYCKD